ncbi:MAG: ribonuclease HI [Candidatus Hydrogenedentes bacterium]|nr:ribonuclease HI [Candidatus Hydrogenedentota bacterium]
MTGSAPFWTAWPVRSGPVSEEGGREKALNAEVVIYTDGGCEPNPGTGGWAAVLLWRGRMREISGGEPETTNNRMELTAAIEALAALKRPCAVRLHTDSEYVKRGVTEWMARWKKCGWRRGKNELKNSDLWKRLDQEASRHRVEWLWVRGHAGNPYNERCDALAGEAIRAIQKNRGPWD